MYTIGIKILLFNCYILVVTLSLFALIIYRCIDQFLKSPLSFLFSFLRSFDWEPNISSLIMCWLLLNMKYVGYCRAHIPHALYFDLYKCCTGTKEIPLNLPEPECWTRYIQSLGVSSDTHVVVYDGQNMRLALRTWWLFRVSNSYTAQPQM